MFIIGLPHTSDSSSVVEIDDMLFRSFSCKRLIDCDFDQDYCGWKEEIAKSKLFWDIGVGRVRDPTKLTQQRLLSTSDNILYTDFTIMQGSTSSMELLSEFIDQPVGGAACIEFEYKVMSFSLDTDLFQLRQYSVDG